MSDISTELAIIESAELGNDVRIAVASAAEKLDEDRSADISQELTVIQNGRYGADIRQAIYDALEKLAGVSPEPGGGGAQVGNAVPVLHGTMLTHVGSLEYPILQGTVEPLVNGGWYWDVNIGTGNVFCFNLQTPPSNRVAPTRLYELPAGKSALISATSEGKQIFVRYSDNGITGSYSTDSGWQNLPYTITNSGAGSLYIGMQFRDPTNANITPEDIGTVTAVMG